MQARPCGIADKRVARFAPQLLLPTHLSQSYLFLTIDLTLGCSVIRLTNHVVTPPLTVEQVKGWLRP